MASSPGTPAPSDAVGVPVVVGIGPRLVAPLAIGAGATTTAAASATVAPCAAGTVATTVSRYASGTGRGGGGGSDASDTLHVAASVELGKLFAEGVGAEQEGAVGAGNVGALGKDFAELEVLDDRVSAGAFDGTVADDGELEGVDGSGAGVPDDRAQAAGVCGDALGSVLGVVEVELVVDNVQQVHEWHERADDVTKVLLMLAVAVVALLDSLSAPKTAPLTIMDAEAGATDTLRVSEPGRTAEQPGEA
ncbi:hypothetical protein AMAG_14274 [Allomyces macrogynus ATCC 38327]|uniref:Uncharacterized protein n=1 Tax=Allomyces macrogynus (strain ATCC 38327) TaxID=578462 RepID=A0A0L0T4I8_ALLM3|nr:hypothetical protein AMAG_14274 [Allomyces macrogynus ATCC 38327]|eukprot:KNE69733.1 hypothetical protein AMAG_14274 [Allomyces macrogynus ATCC 38327]